MGKAATRVKWAIGSKSGPTGFLSGTLFELGVFSFGAGLAERAQAVYRSETNHYTEHALSCIVMMAAGVEALVNALIWMQISVGESDGKMDKKDHKLSQVLADSSLAKKYKWAQEGVEIPSDCVMLSEVRHEILHAIPAMQETGAVPDRLRSLEQRGLFLDENELPQMKGAWLWQQRLCSYELAMWACETAEAAVRKLSKGDAFLGAKARHDLEIVSRYKALAVSHNESATA